MLTLTITHVACALLAGLMPQSGGGGTPSFDGTWTFTVDGQTVQADADGNFTISNVAAPDLFGPAGPGSTPDFLSDHWLRVFGTSAAGVQPLYAVSAPFKFAQGETFLVGGFTLTTTPPGFVETNEITLGTPVLTQLGQTTQATVIGTLSDGVTTLDVTQLYTDYTTSNAAVATVNAAGLVTAAGPGQAFIAAMTDGAVSVAAMEVSLGDPLTTVAGFVALEDGTPVAGADVSLIDQVGTAVSGADGSFSIPGAATTLGPISAAADGVLGGSVYSGSSESVEPVPGGVTDLGVITLLPPVGVLVWDSPGSSTAIVNALVGLGYAVTTSATLPTDLTPYGMIYRGQKPPGPLPPITPVEQAQLKAFVESGRGLHLTGGSNGACCNALNASIETFLSSILVGGSPPIGLTGFSGTLFNPTALQGVTTTPNVLSAFCIPGSCLPGVIGGISTNDPHAFVQGPVTSSVPISGAVWDCGDMLAARGRITLIMASLGFSGSSTLPKLVENMQFFFEGADTCD